MMVFLRAMGVLVLLSGPAAAQTDIQAEDADLFSAYVRQEHGGYTGSGYVSVVSKTGAYLEFVFRRDAAATDTVIVRYANGGSARNFGVSLNGSSLGSFSFASTGGWTTWGTRVLVIALQAGQNRLRLTTTTNTTTYPVVDRITIAGQPAVTRFRLTLAKSGNGAVSATPPATYYDAGASVTLSATPAGSSFLSRWMGAGDSPANPYGLTMNGHKTVVGVFLDTTGISGFTPEAGPRGFAGVNALGQDGTTGGGGGDTIIVTTGDDLWNLMLLRQDAAGTLGLRPLTVFIAGILSPGPVIGGAEMLDVKDARDISIVGIGNDATMTGFGLKIVRASNIIVRNITFAAWDDDGISIQADDNEATGHHIWVDHCTFTDIPPSGYPSGSTPDGSLDISHTAAYVTVSWCVFRDHDKNSLVGHSDSQTSDVAMKVTYHHNWFNGTNQRNPRVRFAKVHVFNNHYTNNGIYGVSSNLEADVMVEGNYFQNVPIPTETSRDGSPPGDLVERYNIFVSCGPPGVRGTAFEPSTFYSYALDSAATVPALVGAYAGAGRYDFSATGVSAMYTLTVFAANGTVTKNPDQPSYAHGTPVQLTATPSPTYSFVQWTGDVPPGGTYLNPLTVTMDAGKTLTANFTNITRTLTVNAVNGTVTKNPDLAQYPDGSPVTLTAVPSPGFFFVSWTGDVPPGREAENPLVLIMDGNKTLTAQFSDQTYTLTTTAVHGSVLRAPNQATYSSGTPVQLTAVPDTGYHFVQWSGDTTGTANPITIVMNADKSVTAVFALNQYALTITSVNGTVAKDPDQSLYDHGTSVNLTASAAPGYLFTSWSGDVTGSANPVAVVMNGPRSVTANFTSLGNIVQSNGTGGGVWTSGATWQGGVAPTAGQSVVIAGTDSVSVSSAVSCSTLTVLSGGRLSATAAITISGLFSLLDGATYYHGASGTFSLPGGTRAIDDASTVVYNYSGGSSSIAGGSFGNLVIMRGASNTNATGVLTINGDLTLSNTSGSAGLRGTSGSTSRTNTVHGNVIITGGTLSCIDAGSGSAVAVWNIDGDVLLADSSIARLSPFSSGAAATVTGIFNIGGDLTITGGRLQYATNSSTLGLGIVNILGDMTVESGSSITDNGSTGPFAVNFKGSGAQTVTLGMNVAVATSLYDTVRSGAEVVFTGGPFTWGSTVATAGGFVVNGSLELGDSSAVAGTGSFLLNPGAKLKMGSAQGISAAGPAGNIRVTGSRSFSTEAGYVYAGGQVQTTGDGLPGTVEGLTISNPSGVLLSAPTTVSGTLQVVAGDLDLNGNTITLGPTAVLAESDGNTVTGAAGSITTTRTLTAPSGSTDIAGLGVSIGSAADLGGTVITRTHATYAGAGGGSIARTFAITPAVNAGLDAVLTFRYDESELQAIPEGALELFRSTDAGAAWTQRGGLVNAAANTITLSGIDAFSHWTAAAGTAAAAVAFSSSSIDFGGVPTGLATRDSLYAFSIGLLTLRVDSVHITDAGFTAAAAPDTLATGDSLLITVTFTPPDTGAYAGSLLVFSNAASSPDTIAVAGLGTGTTMTISLPVVAGWGLVSNPVTAAGDSVRQLFPATVFPYAFGFNAAAGYQQFFRLENGPGYWAKFAVDTVSAITGTILVADTIPVQAGWNLIGSVSFGVDTAGVEWSPPGNRASDYFGFDGAYNAVAVIEPARAYWVKASAPGTVILSPAPASLPASAEAGGR